MDQMQKQMEKQIKDLQNIVNTRTKETKDSSSSTESTNDKVNDILESVNEAERKIRSPDEIYNAMQPITEIDQSINTTNNTIVVNSSDTKAPPKEDRIMEEFFCMTHTAVLKKLEEDGMLGEKTFSAIGMYESALKAEVPFYQWNAWIEARMMLTRNKIQQPQKPANNIKQQPAKKYTNARAGNSSAYSPIPTNQIPKQK